LGGHAQSQMHQLKEVITSILGIFWVFHEDLRFGVQCTISRVCGGEKMFSIFGDKTRCFVSSCEGSKTICFKDFFTHPLIKVWKKSQPLFATCKE
jgi:hypothetical protein